MLRVFWLKRNCPSWIWRRLSGEPTMHMRCTVFSVARCAGRLRLCWVRVISKLLKALIHFQSFFQSNISIKTTIQQTYKIENFRKPSNHCHCTGDMFQSLHKVRVLRDDWLKFGGTGVCGCLKSYGGTKGMVQTASFPLSFDIHRWNDAYLLWCAGQIVPR